MVGWRKVLALTGWLSLGATLGPPLFGAASTLFWNEAADGNTAVRVAWRTYDRISPPPVGLAYIPKDERLPSVSLGISCHQHYQKGIESADFGTLVLWDVVRHYSEHLLDDSLRLGPAHKALLSLPRPVLGALDACIGGSPLIWTLCQTYAKRVTDEAQAELAKSREAIIDRVRRENEVIWCAAANANSAEVR